MIYCRWDLDLLISGNEQAVHEEYEAGEFQCLVLDSQGNLTGSDIHRTNSR